MKPTQPATLIRTAKEFARHVLHSIGWRRDAPYLRLTSRVDRFDYIYNTGVWKMGNPNTPASGVGSSLAATRELRQQLPQLLKRLDATSLLDVGCGDFTWMREIELPCAYTGVDIVPSVVAANNNTYSSDKRTFALCDAVSDSLPEGDVVLCREVLFHLSFADAKAALRNILSGKRRYLLATTDRATQFNANIPSGDFRLLNLALSPFRFPQPFLEIDDSEVARGRIIGVWPVADIRNVLQSESLYCL